MYATHRSGGRRARPCLVGRATSRTEKRVLTERRKAYEWSSALSRSPWWLVVRDDDSSFEVLTLDGGDTLPVFSGEGEAGLFLWLRGALEHGWEVHESRAEELVFLLSGPCSRAELVAIDPSVEILDDENARLSREDFLEWIVSSGL